MSSLNLLTSFSRPTTVSGHRVLCVLDGSPGDEAGLVPFLDLIVLVEKETLDDGERTLAALLSKRVDIPTELTVFNMKTKAMRKTTITPNRRWGGPGCLGVVARFDSLDSKRPFVFQVTSVAADSPASAAGLVESSDFILGSDHYNLKTAEDVRLLLAAGKKAPPAVKTGEDQNEFGDGSPASEPKSATSTPAAITVRPPSKSIGDESISADKADGDDGASPASAAAGAAVAPSPPGSLTKPSLVISAGAADALNRTAASSDAAAPASTLSSASSAAPVTDALFSPTGLSTDKPGDEGAAESAGFAPANTAAGDPGQSVPQSFEGVKLVVLFVYHSPSDSVRVVALEPSEAPIPVPPPKPTLAALPPDASSSSSSSEASAAAEGEKEDKDKKEEDGEPEKEKEKEKEDDTGEAGKDDGGTKKEDGKKKAAPRASVLGGISASLKAATSGISAPSLSMPKFLQGKKGRTSLLSSAAPMASSGTDSGYVDEEEERAAAEGGADKDAKKKAEEDGGSAAKPETIPEEEEAEGETPAPATSKAGDKDKDKEEEKKAAKGAPRKSVFAGLVSNAKSSLEELKGNISSSPSFITAQKSAVAAAEVSGAAASKAAAATAAAATKAAAATAAAASSAASAASAAAAKLQTSKSTRHIDGQHQGDGSADPLQPPGDWHPFVGARLMAVPEGLPHTAANAKSLGKRLSTMPQAEIDKLQDAAQRERLERLGCLDMFGRLTGVSLEEATKQAQAALEEVQKKFTNLALAAAMGASVSAVKSGNVRRDSASNSTTNSGNATPSAGGGDAFSPPAEAGTLSKAAAVAPARPARTSIGIAGGTDVHTSVHVAALHGYSSPAAAARLGIASSGSPAASPAAGGSKSSPVASPARPPRPSVSGPPKKSSLSSPAKKKQDEDNDDDDTESEDEDAGKRKKKAKKDEDDDSEEEDEDGDDDSSKAGKSSSPAGNGKPPTGARRTRGAIKRQSLAGAQDRARKMGMFVAGASGSQRALAEEDEADDGDKEHSGAEGSDAEKDKKTKGGDDASSSSSSSSTAAAGDDNSSDSPDASTAPSAAARASKPSRLSVAGFMAGVGSSLAGAASGVSTRGGLFKVPAHVLEEQKALEAEELKKKQEKEKAEKREKERLEREKDKKEAEKLSAAADMPLWQLSAKGASGNLAPVLHKSSPAASPVVAVGAPAPAPAPSGPSAATVAAERVSRASVRIGAGIAGAFAGLGSAVASAASSVGGRRNSLTDEKEGSGAAMAGGKGLVTGANAASPVSSAAAAALAAAAAGAGGPASDPTHPSVDSARSDGSAAADDAAAGGGAGGGLGGKKTSKFVMGNPILG